jgi:hypothetical protein
VGSRNSDHDGPWRGLFGTLQAAATRRSLVKGGGIAGVAALTGGAWWLRAEAQDAPDLQESIDAAITLEAFAVTLTGVARDWGRRLDFSDDEVRFLRATQCQDEAHYHFFDAAGATPLTTTFSIANATFADRDTCFTALLQVKEIMVGAYLTMAREVAALGDLRLVEVAYQIGAVEAQHQALTRERLGKRLANDRAFAEWRFRDLGDALDALTEAGFIDGRGKKYAFPGPVDRFCRDVFGLVPETTEDQEVITPEASPLASPAL